MSAAPEPVHEAPAPVSLLWPSGPPRRTRSGPQLPADAAADLQLDEVVRALVVGGGRPARRHHREQLVRQALTDLCTDPTVIAYRQEIVDDLLASASLRERLAALLPDLDSLADRGPARRFQTADDAAVQRVARQLGDLELFVDVARQLAGALHDVPLRAPGLIALRGYVDAVTTTATFLALAAELPTLRQTFSQAGSVTIGVNLTPDLVPESATILALNEERFEGARTLLGKLLGGRDGNRGITSLQRGGANGFVGPPNRLTQDLTRLLEEIAAPVGSALDRYAALPIETLSTIGPELALLLNGALLVERMARAGLPMCRPEILPVDDRLTELHDGYDISLALRLHRTSGAQPGGSMVAPGDGRPPPPDGSSIVTNLIAFGDSAGGRVWVLTGPNRAGKTTFTRAVGLAHALFQAGLYVPASRASLSPVDAIYTHFPSLEQAQPGKGRLDEEAERLAGIFRRATSASLVLLNETLAGTAASEAEAIARDALRGLRLLGARAVYVTHLHDLALAVDAINASTPGASLVGSLVADAEDEEEHAPTGPQHRRTYRIHPGLPRGRSYASEIARRHGISYGQLVTLLRERGLAAAGSLAPGRAGAADDS